MPALIDLFMESSRDSREDSALPAERSRVEVEDEDWSIRSVPTDMPNSDFAHRVFAQAVGTIGSEESSAAACRDGALMIGLLATIMVPSEAELSDLLRAAPAAFGDPFAIEIIAKAFNIFQADQRRLAHAVARLARRAHDEGEIPALYEIVYRALIVESWRPHFSDDLFSAALTWALAYWPENEGAAGGLVRGALAGNNPIPEWVAQHIDHFPDLVASRYIPWRSAVRLHQRRPSTGGWHFLVDAGGADELTIQASSFGSELDAAIATLEVAMAESNASRRVRMTKWLVALRGGAA
jgi:hypothetical protein